MGEPSPDRQGFLASLDEQERRALIDRASTRRFRRGTYLFSEGDLSDHVVVIVQGRVKICSYTADGGEVVYAMRGPGELLGELSTLDGRPRSATVAALDPVEALLVPAPEFQAYLEEHPRVAVMLLRTVVGRLREANLRRVEFGTHDVTGRVAQRLLELAEQFGERINAEIHVELPLTQEELAGWTGASREAVSKALRSLRDRGTIRTHRREIVIRDLEALQRRAT